MIFVASLFLSAGCPALKTLPNPLGSHRLADKACIKILVEFEPEQFRPARYCYPPGSVIATPEAIRAAQ